MTNPIIDMGKTMAIAGFICLFWGGDRKDQYVWVMSFFGMATVLVVVGVILEKGI